MSVSATITWVEQIEDQGFAAAEELYVKCRAEFLAFAKRYSLPEQDVLDVYQDAILVLYENVKAQKVNAQSCSAKTYLFAVGKNMMLTKLKKNSRLVFSDILTKEEESVQFNLAEEEKLNAQQLAMVEQIKKLGEKCRLVLTYFYYNKMSIKEIMQHMNYANENTVKAHKSRCIKALQTKLITSKG